MARSQIREGQVLDEDFLSEIEHSNWAHHFIQEVDTPTTYSGALGKYLRVTSSGIEFCDISGLENLVFTNTQVLLASGTNYEDFFHNLSKQFVSVTTLFKPTIDIYHGWWVNGENSLVVENYDADTIRVFNESSSDIAIGDAKIVVDVGATVSSGTGGTASTTFMTLSDTPDLYTNNANRYIRVKSDESGLEYVTDLNLEIKQSFGSSALSVKEFTIINDNIVKTEYFDYSGGARKYYTDYSYDVNDNLTSYIITRDSDLVTQLFTCTYSGGEVINIIVS